MGKVEKEVREGRGGMMKYEVFVNGRWVIVSKCIFDMWSGKKRKG